MAPKMTMKEAGEETRRRLLETAEEMFSEKGFDRVSMRDITIRAKANVAAVNYHFGGREGLVGQVISRYIDPVNEERLARLDSLERRAGSGPVAVEELLDAFVRPFATQVRRSDLSERLFYKLMGRIMGDAVPEVPDGVMSGFETMLTRFRKAFAKSLPGLDEDELVWRIHFMVGAMIHTMAHGETLFRLSDGASGRPSMEGTLSRFIRFAAAGLRQEQGDAGAKGGSEGEFLF